MRAHYALRVLAQPPVRAQAARKEHSTCEVRRISCRFELGREARHVPRDPLEAAVWVLRVHARQRVVKHGHVYWQAPRLQRCAARAAELVPVEAVELNALLHERVQVRRHRLRVGRRAVPARIRPSVVIDERVDDVRLRRRGGGEGAAAAAQRDDSGGGGAEERRHRRPRRRSGRRAIRRLRAVAEACRRVKASRRDASRDGKSFRCQSGWKELSLSDAAQKLNPRE